MPQNWKTYKLGKVAALQRGFDLPTRKRIQGNYKVIAASGFTDWHNEYKVKGPGVTTGRSGTLGQVFYEEDDFWPLNTSLWVKDFHGNHPRFIYYFLKELNLGAFNSGTSVPTLNRNDVHSLEVKIPPLPEQKAIANILSAIDAKIENNLSINKTLEEMAMALYKEWFVDFGPFQDGKFTESELGMIPEGWEVRRLGDFVTHQKGFAFKSKWYKTEGELVVRVSDTTHNSINIDSCHKISNELAEKYKSYSLNTDDVIIATVGSWPPNYSSVVGKVIRVPKTAEGGLLNQNAVRLKMSIDNKQYQALLYCILKNDRFLNYIINSAQGSASQASIKLIDIFNYPIIITHSETFNSFSTLVESFITKQNLNTVQNQSLTQLRDTLLPKLISGEVRLKDFDLEEVLEE